MWTTEELKKLPYTFKDIVEIDHPKIWGPAQKCLQITEAWQEMTLELMPLYKKRSTLVNYFKLRSLYGLTCFIAERVNRLCHELAVCANEQDQDGLDKAKTALANLFEAFGKVDALDIVQDNTEGFHKLEQAVEGFGKGTSFPVMNYCTKEGLHASYWFRDIVGALKKGESSYDSLWEAADNSPDSTEAKISGLMESEEDNKNIRIY